MKHHLFSRFTSVLLAVVMLAGLMGTPILATDNVLGAEPAATVEEQTAGSADESASGVDSAAAEQAEEITTDEEESASSDSSTDPETSGEEVVSGDEADSSVPAEDESDSAATSEEESTDSVEVTEPADETEAVDETDSTDETEPAEEADVELTTSVLDENGTTVANVTVEAAEGVIPEGAKLVAELLTGEKADKAAAELNEAGVEYDGYMALDIHLENDKGEEVEPNGEVRVVMVAPAALPEEADPTTVAVRHHEEQADGTVKVEEVASAADTAALAVTPATLDLTEDSSEETPAPTVTTDNSQVTADFTVENFSTFTITWTGNPGSGEQIYVNIVGVTNVNGTSFSAGESLTKQDIIEKAELPTYVQENGKYYYLSSVLADDNKDFNTISYDTWWDWGQKKGWRRHYTRTTIIGTTTNEADEIDNITVTYSEYSRPQAIKTVDTSDKIEIELYDYDIDLINSRYVFEFGGNGNDDFNKWSSYVADIHGVTFEGIYQDIVDDNGAKGTGERDQSQYYPQLNQVVTGSSESLAYLFSDSVLPGKTSYEGLNRLFLQSEYNNTGYYVYNSARNFATLVGSSGTDFTVYENPTTDSGEARFMPFNDITSNNGEYPIVGEKNFYYGMHIGFEMLQTADGKVVNPLNSAKDDMVFEFNGDDDLWVFIDGTLVLDLGGIHGAAGGKINFSTGEVTAGTGNVEVYLNQNNRRVQYQNGGVKTWKEQTTIKDLLKAADPTLEDSAFDGNTFTDWSTHRVDIYYLERGAGKSNCELKFNIQAIPTGSLTVGKTAVGAQEGLNYKFKVTDSAGKPVANVSYQKNGTETGGSTDSNGVFTLQSGEYAVFSGLEQGDYHHQRRQRGLCADLCGG